MSKQPIRHYGRGHLHFIAFSCYRRLAWLRSVAREYPILDTFQGRGFWLDFLCPEAQAGEFGQEFVGRSEVESRHSQMDCRGDVFSQVVDVQSFFRQGV